MPSRCELLWSEVNLRAAVGARPYSSARSCCHSVLLLAFGRVVIIGMRFPKRRGDPCRIFEGSSDCMQLESHLTHKQNRAVCQAWWHTTSIATTGCGASRSLQSDQRRDRARPDRRQAHPVPGPETLISSVIVGALLGLAGPVRRLLGRARGKGVGLIRRRTPGDLYTDYLKYRLR